MSIKAAHEIARRNVHTQGYVAALAELLRLHPNYDHTVASLLAVEGITLQDAIEVNCPGDHIERVAPAWMHSYARWPFLPTDVEIKPDSLLRCITPTLTADGVVDRLRTRYKVAGRDMVDVRASADGQRIIVRGTDPAPDAERLCIELGRRPEGWRLTTDYRGDGNLFLDTLDKLASIDEEDAAHRKLLAEAAKHDTTTVSESA